MKRTQRAAHGRPPPTNHAARPTQRGESGRPRAWGPPVMTPPRTAAHPLLASPTVSTPGAPAHPDRTRRPLRNPTMQDVARAAGVSLKTVSRVVNLESGVDQRTAAKVEDA